MVQILSTEISFRCLGEIPPTGVGGWFRSFLQKSRSVAWEKSHQRELVDGSDPFYLKQQPTKLLPGIQPLLNQTRCILTTCTGICTGLPQLIDSSLNQYLWIILSNKVLAVVHQQ